MKGFSIKSKKGFTLIELLVVIGILAVLAAIAIPSVAGLIDRANVSADNTNANEMTNAIERFASEYELYVQDIGSGALDPNNLDSAQGRVYNITKATTRADITAIEKSQNTDITSPSIGIAIYRDTKYPANEETVKILLENYMKTSSSTFEPKQSDMHYWYSPDCGVVVVAEPEKTDIELDKYIVSGKDAKGNDISSDDVNAQWIDLTLYYEFTVKLNPSGTIPKGAKYYSEVGSTKLGDYSTATATYKEGDKFPTIKDGDVFVFEDYEYRYNYSGSNGGSNLSEYQPEYNGWSVMTLSLSKSEYSPILESINGQYITNMTATFYRSKIVKSPKIPKTVTRMDRTFSQCKYLTNDGLPYIPLSVQDAGSCFNYCLSLTDVSHLIVPSEANLNYIFSDCYNLEYPPTFKESKIDKRWAHSAFLNCSSLKKAPIIPDNIVVVSGIFKDNTSLTGTVTFNNSFTYSGIFEAFHNVDFQKQKITLSGKYYNLDALGATGVNYCAECNGYCKLGHELINPR